MVHLSDICQRVRTKNFNTQCTLVLTIAAQFGLVSQEEFFNKSVASDNLEGYYLLRKGDFAYNKSYSGDYAWGAVKRLECFSEGVLSPLYICFRPDTARIDSDFLAHYFESKKWYKGIADIAGEGARNHGLLNLSVIDYFKTLHRIPSIQEQKAIANALNKLTSKISIEKNLYDDLLYMNICWSKYCFCLSKFATYISSFSIFFLKAESKTVNCNCLSSVGTMILIFDKSFF